MSGKDCLPKNLSLECESLCPFFNYTISCSGFHFNRIKKWNWKMSVRLPWRSLTTLEHLWPSVSLISKHQKLRTCHAKTHIAVVCVEYLYRKVVASQWWLGLSILWCFKMSISGGLGVQVSVIQRYCNYVLEPKNFQLQLRQVPSVQLSVYAETKFDFSFLFQLRNVTSPFADCTSTKTPV